MDTTLHQTASPQALSPELSRYEIRPCVSLDDFRACLEMQREVWQFADLDITPLRSFVITRHSGGFTLGAFAPDEGLIGFAHALAAFENRQRPYFYSQMLAVRESWQSAGIGAKLKLAQRDHALSLEIPVLRWTFDPLLSRNAYLNIARLGGVVRKYIVNYYGTGSTSVLHAGLETDRLFVEWWVGSDRVTRALKKETQNVEPAAAVEVPYDIQIIRDRDMAEARLCQSRIRQEFQQHLATGLYCAGFERGENGENSKYLFYPDHREEVAEGY